MVEGLVKPNPIFSSTHSNHTASSQTHAHVTHSTNTYYTHHKHVICTRQNTRTTCTTHTCTHRNHTSPGPHTSIAVTPALSQHTHIQQYTPHSHRNNRTHNIGYYDNLTKRPRTTTGLQTHRPSSKSERNLIILQVNINGLRNKLEGSNCLFTTHMQTSSQFRKPSYKKSQNT